MFTTFIRAFRFAFKNFYRNKGISVAVVFVLTLTILLLTGLFFMKGASDFLVETIRDQIDIIVYFKSETAEEDILGAKDEILKNSPSVKNMRYVSKTEALSEFLRKYEGNVVFSTALNQVGDNPFLPSLRIVTTGEPRQYEELSNIFQGGQYAKIIDKVDFSEKKDTIEKIFAFTARVGQFGLTVAAILIFIVVMVVFNTIKLVIENSRDEIGTMRIVGASSWFVRSPFIIEGGLFGFSAFLVCFLLTAMSAYVFSVSFGSLLPGFNLFDYFLSNFWLIVLIQLACGVGLGVFSSYIAVSKHLKV